ncbi:hypothetical protein [Ferruginibacter sp. HRS2-29]|uniref:hypothetical protein n=1 Tax=Ferruginibacter sp. HRS2-29 TaxID=2487334 RepID=UPI0020CC5F9C|nr:hypothetical protein [Ferruginibacter sp. HRS2-29]
MPEPVSPWRNGFFIITNPEGVEYIFAMGCNPWCRCRSGATNAEPVYDCPHCPPWRRCRSGTTNAEPVDDCPHCPHGAGAEPVIAVCHGCKPLRR